MGLRVDFCWYTGTRIMLDGLGNGFAKLVDQALQCYVDIKKFIAYSSALQAALSMSELAV